MTMSRDNRELLRVGLVGVGPGSTLSDRILLTLLDDLDAADKERNDLVARYETQVVEVARKAYDQRDAALATVEAWTQAVAGATKNAEKAVTLSLLYAERLAAALAVLREVEWQERANYWRGCPSCWGDEGDGHKPDCKLDAVLKGMPPTGPSAAEIAELAEAVENPHSGTAQCADCGSLHAPKIGHFHRDGCRIARVLGRPTTPDGLKGAT